MAKISLIRPGSSVIYGTSEENSQIEKIILLMEDCVEKAAITLNEYKLGRQRLSSQQREARIFEIRDEVASDVMKEYGDQSSDRFEESHIKEELMLAERLDALDIMPQTYAFKLPFIYAHSFVYALDTFVKSLEKLDHYSNIRVSNQNVLSILNAKLPALIKVRNSAHHIEDRMLGFLKQKDAKTRTSFSGPLYLGNLEGDSLQYTIDDGTVQNVPVNEASLVAIYEAMVATYLSLKWKGSARVAFAY